MVIIETGALNKRQIKHTENDRRNEAGLVNQSSYLSL